MQSFYSFGLAVIMAGMSGALVKSCAKNSDTIIRYSDQAIPPGTGSVIRHGAKALNQEQDQ